MAWKRGPLPPDTYGWGGVVAVTQEALGGFFFADFCGDTVQVNDGRTLSAEAVAWYDNSLTLPPVCNPVTGIRLGVVLLCLLGLGAHVQGGSDDVAAALAMTKRASGLTYSEARAKAVAERRDLILWIGGMVCPPCVAETPDCVHCHVASLDGDDSPRVLVGVYNPADGKLWCLGYAYACTSGPNGTLSQERARVRATFQSPAQYQQPAAAPVYQQPFRSFGGSRSC